MNQKNIRFTKMHGAGNDFVLVSALEEDIILSRQQIARLCDRRFGVGADGLMILRKSSQAGADVRMSYYNSDGGEAEMCGNGARCFARFAKRELDWNKPRITIQTGAGLVAAEYEGELVRLMMTPPRDWLAPFLIQALGENFSVAFVNTGVPHAVMQVNDLEKLDVRSLGSAIRHHSEFAPSGTNANFFAFAADGAILLRTYERGVEDETLACGTGVVATALVAHRYYGGTMPASIRVRGGDYLRVETSECGQVFLIGPATFVFEGEVQIN
jgi:diaminopimelate epimerase